jgi:hypothetical protein
MAKPKDTTSKDATTKDYTSNNATTKDSTSSNNTSNNAKNESNTPGTTTRKIPSFSSVIKYENDDRERRDGPGGN